MSIKSINDSSTQSTGMDTLDKKDPRSTFMLYDKVLTYKPTQLSTNHPVSWMNIIYIYIYLYTYKSILFGVTCFRTHGKISSLLWQLTSTSWQIQSRSLWRAIQRTVQALSMYTTSITKLNTFQYFSDTHCKMITLENHRIAATNYTTTEEEANLNIHIHEVVKGSDYPDRFLKGHTYI